MAAAKKMFKCVQVVWISKTRSSWCVSRLHYNDVITGTMINDCLLNGLFRRRSKKTSKLCVTGLCAGNWPGTGEFPAQMASNERGKCFHSMTSSWEKAFMQPLILDCGRSRVPFRFVSPIPRKQISFGFIWIYFFMHHHYVFKKESSAQSIKTRYHHMKIWKTMADLTRHSNVFKKGCLNLP